MVSHGFNPTKNVFENNKIGSSFGLMASQGFSSISQFVIFFVLGIILLTCYGLAGFYGIGLCAIGLFAIPVTIISINFMAGITNDSFLLAKVSRVYGSILDNIFRVLWAARNYSIYI
jgi:Na+/H+-translocating membrane pyrophosphatase